MKGFDYLIILVIGLNCSQSIAQHKQLAVLWDSINAMPVPMAYVYNGSDHTTTNADGRFLFTSTTDEITIYKAGYQKFRSALEQLPDTIFLDRTPYELEEVVVTHVKTLLQKIKDSIQSNYQFTPFEERFMLRCVLRRNDSIVRLQDLQGKLWRKTLIYGGGLELEKKDYVVELENMRKVGLVSDMHDVYFVFPSLHQVFSQFVRINATGEGFQLREERFAGEMRTRWVFQSGPKGEQIDISGHYIINNSNNAIESFHLKSVAKNNPYNKDGRVLFRTLQYEMEVYFSEDPSTGKYYMSQARSNELVETTDADKTFSDHYDIGFILTTSDNFQNLSTKSNVNERKDIFKLKHPFNPTYWKQQNQLLLTEEMRQFIANSLKEPNEFKVRTNLD